MDTQINDALIMEDLDEEFIGPSIVENLVRLNKQGMEHLSQGSFFQS